MKISLIITTYNRPEALAVVLNSVKKQRLLPNEVLIADDGSTAATSALLVEAAQDFPCPIAHIWQEDLGFRLAEIRNKALAKASGEYIVLIDGDMVLDKNFIYDHSLFAQKGSFIQGSRCLLDELLTARLLSGELEMPNFFSQGLAKPFSSLRILPLAKLITLFKNQNLRRTKFCNVGFWLEDAQKINGFDNRFVGWGREDSDFVARLYHSGIYRRNLKFAAIAYHLWHAEHSRKALKNNEELLNFTLRNRLVLTPNGMGEITPQIY